MKHLIGEKLEVKSYAIVNKAGGTTYSSWEKDLPKELEVIPIHFFYDYETGWKFWGIVSDVKTHEATFKKYSMSARDFIDRYVKRVEGCTHLFKDDYEKAVSEAKMLQNSFAEKMFENNFIIFCSQFDVISEL